MVKAVVKAVVKGNDHEPLGLLREEQGYPAAAAATLQLASDSG